MKIGKIIACVVLSAVPAFMAGILTTLQASVRDPDGFRRVQDDFREIGTKQQSRADKSS